MAWISSPPTIGPATAASPDARPNSEKDWPRSSGGKVTVAMASTCGVIMAPARPCSTRAAISHSIDGRQPQNAEAALKAVTPIRNMWVRPTMSPSRPKGRQAERKGQHIGGDHPFDLAGIGAEIGLH